MTRESISAVRPVALAGVRERKHQDEDVRLSKTALRPKEPIYQDELTINAAKALSRVSLWTVSSFSTSSRLKYRRRENVRWLLRKNLTSSIALSANLVKNLAENTVYKHCELV